jgi:hypothetical protein
MIEKKFSHLRGLAERTDFDQILVLQNQSDDAFSQLRFESFQQQLHTLEVPENGDDWSGLEIALALKQLRHIEKQVSKFTERIRELLAKGEHLMKKVISQKKALLAAKQLE